MLWVYGHYKYFLYFSVGTAFVRQDRDVQKRSPAERVNDLFILYCNHNSRHGKACDQTICVCHLTCKASKEGSQECCPNRGQYGEYLKKNNQSDFYLLTRFHIHKYIQ